MIFNCINWMVCLAHMCAYPMQDSYMCFPRRYRSNLRSMSPRGLSLDVSRSEDYVGNRFSARYFDQVSPAVRPEGLFIHGRRERAAAQRARVARTQRKLFPVNGAGPPSRAGARIRPVSYIFFALNRSSLDSAEQRGALAAVLQQTPRSNSRGALTSFVLFPPAPVHRIAHLSDACIARALQNARTCIKFRTI